MFGLPVRVVGALVVAAALLGGGYWMGTSVESGRCAQAQLDTATAYAQAWQSDLEVARADAAAESKRREEAALRNARAAARAQEIKLRGQAHAIETARAGCDWPADRIGLLNDAVDAANGTAAEDAGAIGMPGGVPGAASGR